MATLVPLRCGLALAVLIGGSAACAAEPYTNAGDFSITYTFTRSTPAGRVLVGAGRDLTVNNYLATTVNDAGRGLMHHMAGHCINIRFTNREQRTIESKGYCNFRDMEGDMLYAEYATGVVPSKAITFTLKFVAGSGKYDGITGQAQATNTNNLDDQGSYQAAGKMAGNFKILRAATASQEGTHD